MKKPSITRKELKQVVKQNFFMISKAMSFPLNVVFAPYHFVISGVLMAAAYLGYIGMPWYLGILPTIISWVINFYMILMLSFIMVSQVNIVEE